MPKESRLGRRLQRFRERAGLTQHELAERAGVARTIIANLERGSRAGITLSNALRIADALGISVDQLARGDVLEDTGYDLMGTAV
jgi:transcriptional regulator with XRE-family HTH domain